jgi:D-alanyl-D-alanine carboxypeptidase (penicillin-binding protein 5/6)
MEALMSVKRSLGFLAILLAFIFWPCLLEAEDLELTSRSAILMDMNTGKILYSHNPNERLQPASITKILTLYMVDENIQQNSAKLSDLVKISCKAGRTGGSKMFIKAGSEIPLGELIKGIAVVSANDASVAVAEHIAGSVETFVMKMNQKAGELGMFNSNFKNPNGLPAKGQFTTAKDMLILAYKYLERFPEAIDLHSVQHYTYRNITQHNRNTLLMHYPDADGLKTGWVAKAGYHIIATAKRDNTRLIAVVMGAKNPAIRSRETKNLLDMGFRIINEIQRQG